MSLQQIEKSNVKSSQQGMKREIHESSQKMMMDVLQVSQYTKPVESTVRELTSNAVDSQKEKEIAIEILEGRADPEDYFLQREEDKFKDSNWSPQYYDLNHLDRKNNTVEIRYIEGKGSGYCDKLIIRDYGVGLGNVEGHNRLSGYFSLGFSSKRNSKDQLGAYGLGAKAGLSTRCSYYTLNTVHNGRKFSFNCYAYKIDSLIPRFNLESGEKNPHIIIGTSDDGQEDDYIAHYEKTDEKNYSEVVIPFKRTRRTKLREAVKNQLLYFDKVDFYYQDESGHERKINFQANILHNSPSLLISDTHRYRRPHIVIVKDKDQETGVCYGTIDFKELEMERLSGRVGFKCPIRSVKEDPETGEEIVIQDGVSVTPSRESVIWDEHTRAYVKSVIDDAKEEASRLIQDKLDEENFFLWLKKSAQVISRATNTWGSQTALSTLTQIIDKTNIKPRYPKDKTIKYDSSPSNFFWGLKPRNIKKANGKWSNKLGGYTTKIDRSDLASWSNFNPEAMYLVEDDTRHSKTKDRYLTELHGGNFTAFKIEEDEKLREMLKEAQGSSQTSSDKSIEKLIKNKLEYRDKIFELLNGDDEYELKSYKDIDVPDDFEKKVEEEQQEVELTPKEKRKLQNRTVAFTMKLKRDSYNTRIFKRHKKQPKLQELQDVENTVYYLTSKDDDLMQMCCEFFVNQAKEEQDYYRPSFYRKQDAMNEDYNTPLFLRFSKRNRKHVRDNPKFKKIRKLLYNHDEDMKRLGDHFIPYFTAREIEKDLESLRFFRNFEMFNKELYDAYNFLVDYVDTHYKKVKHSRMTSNSQFKKFTEFAEKCTKLQKFASTTEDDEAVLEKGKEIFDEEVKGAEAVDMSIISLAQELFDYAENIKKLFNGIDFLTQDCHPDRSGKIKDVPSDVERLINILLEEEGLNRYTLSEDSQKLLQSINTTKDTSDNND